MSGVPPSPQLNQHNQPNPLGGNMNRITLFRTTPRIVMGPGALNQLADEVEAMKANKVLIVTDQGLIDAGLVKKAQTVLDNADISTAVFGDVEADPRYEIVADCVEMIRSENADLIIGFGGGSPIDIAKVSAVMATNEGPISEYFGIDLVHGIFGKHCPETRERIVIGERFAKRQAKEFF